MSNSSFLLASFNSRLDVGVAVDETKSFTPWWNHTMDWSTTVTLSNCYHACANVHQLACTRVMNHTKLFIYSKYVLSVCVRARARVCVCVCASWPQMTNNIHVLYIICLKPKWRGSRLENGKNCGSTPRCSNLSFTSSSMYRFEGFTPKRFPIG